MLHRYLPRNVGFRRSMRFDPFFEIFCHAGKNILIRIHVHGGLAERVNLFQNEYDFISRMREVK
jgi:hypothetical protein